MVLAGLLLASVFAVVSPTQVAAQEAVSVNIQGGNDIDVRVNNVKRDSAVIIPFETRTEAERQFRIDLDQIEVWTYSDMSGFNLDIDIRATPPHGEPRMEGVEGLAYLDVVPTGLQDNDIDEMRFRFSVYKTELRQLGAEGGHVVMHRYNDGEWQEIDLQIHQETTDRFVYDAELPGLSVFSIGVEQPVFEFADASVSSTSVREGGSVEVRASLRNTGPADGSTTVNLEVDGDIEDSRSVSVPAGESRSVTFTKTFDEIGVYDVTLNGVDVGSVRVESGAGGGDGADGGDGGDASGGDDGAGDGDGNQLPGFGLLVAVVALAAVLLLRRR